MKSIIFSILIVIITTQSYAQWNQQSSGSSSDLNAVYFLNADTGFAVGDYGTLLKTTDGGNVWNDVNTGIQQNLRAIHFGDDTTGYIVGQGDTILKTIDAGNTWQTLLSGVGGFYFSVRFTSADTGYVGGFSGLIIKTIDGGQNWITQISGVTQNIYSFFFTGPLTGYAACSGGKILKTTNGGTSWALLTSGTSVDLNDVFFTSATTGFVVGANGKILATTNSGTSWTQKVSGTTTTLNSVYFTDNSHGFANGDNGLILYSTNAGGNWYQMVSGVNTSLNSIIFTSSNTGYSVGALGKILKTQNSGFDTITIIKNPVSQMGIVGKNATFSVSVKGTKPISFQWKYNGNPISGATDSVYTIAGVNPTHQGFYSCAIQNPLGIAYSDTAELMMFDNAEVPGDTMNITVLNAVGNLQWQQSADSTTWTDISNATSTVYSYVSAGNSGDVRYYRVKIVDPECPAVTHYSSSVKNRVFAQTSDVPLGAGFRGGKVFYNDGAGNGLIAIPFDLGSYAFGCPDVDIPWLSVTDGFSNTNDIVSACSVRPIAASVCDTLIYDNYDDWYLPALDQLAQLITYRDYAGGISPFSTLYASSTQSSIDANYCWYIGIGVWQTNKNDAQVVRPVRTFTSADIYKHTNAVVNVSGQIVPTRIDSIGYDSILCNGQHTEIRIHASGSTYPTYNFYKDSQLVSSSTYYNYYAFQAYEFYDSSTFVCEIVDICGIRADTIMLKVISMYGINGIDAGKLVLCNQDSFIVDYEVYTNHPEYASYTYSWSPDTAFSDPHVATPYFTGTQGDYIGVVITNSVGCSGNGSYHIFRNGFSAEATSSGFQDPGNGSTMIVCGDSAQFETEVTIIGAPTWDNPISQGLTYQWSPAANLDNDTIANPVAFPTDTIQYIVQVSNDYGCTSSDTLILNVRMFDIMANYMMGNTITCGDTVQIDGWIDPWTPDGITFQWSPSVGLSNDTILEPLAFPVVSTTYSVTGTTANGCIATDDVVLNVMPFTIYSNFVPLEKVCGDSVFLSADNNADFPLSYTWSPATYLDNDTIINPVAVVVDSIEYTVTAIAENGCAATAVRTINVSPISVTVSSGLGSYQAYGHCLDSTWSQVNTNYSGGDSLLYHWLDTALVSDSTSDHPTIYFSGNHNMLINVSTNEGCYGTGYFNALMVPFDQPNICVVGVNASNKNEIVWEKTITSSAPDSVFIFKETTTSNFVRIGAVPYDSLGVFVDMASNPNVQSNKYKISVQDECDLESQQSDFHKTMHLTINQGMGSTWNLIWESYEGLIPSEYRIYRGTHPDSIYYLGMTSASSTSYTDLNPPAGYVYYQVAIMTSGCNPDKTYDISLSNIATNDPSAGFAVSLMQPSFSIFPNPASDHITVRFSSGLQGVADVSVFNMIGELVYKKQIAESDNVIPVENLTDGVYQVEINSHNIIEKHRLVIHK